MGHQNAHNQRNKKNQNHTQKVITGQTVHSGGDSTLSKGYWIQEKQAQSNIPK